MRTFVLIFALLTSLGSPTFALDVPEEATAVGAVEDGDPRAETRLIVDRSSVQLGDEIRVGVLFELDPEWHVYGEDPGEAGLPTSIVWRGEGAEIGSTSWPPTETFVDPSGRIETTGYSERVVLEAPARIAAADGEVKIVAEVDYLACRVKCLPGSAKLVRTLAVGSSTPASDEVLALFDNFGRDRPPSPAPVKPATPAASVDAAPEEPANPIPLWQALLLAFLGGILLNLMPCVFPVLALKIFGFVSTSAHRPTALRHSAAYAAGIIASMLVLAAVVVGVKLGGEAVGWGFQFQQPGYLVALTMFVVLFALNLFGVFDVQTLPLPSHGSSESAGRSFVDGGLAVVLATPCSAPFLGTAVGFALASSTLVIFATFVAVGLGLAAPFVLASAIPAVGRRLPKPGPWMEHLERVLGFVLLGTAVWLVWVFGRVAGVDGVAALLACAVAASLGGWIYGRVQYSAGRGKVAGALAAIALAIVPLAVLAPWSFDAPTATDGTATSRWQKWDRERIATEQAAGHVVFVDFTADWCITCKVNERVALSSDAIWQHFQEHRVVAMKADWTKRDDTIRAELARFGRGGVPMYLVYPAGGGEPELLSEVLTESIVIDAIERNLRTSHAR